MNERELQESLIEGARWAGWPLVYHTHDSRRSAPGFPDLVFARRGRLIFAELKSKGGMMSAAQREWLAALQSVEVETGGIVSAHLWKPADFDGAIDVLNERATPYAGYV